MDFTGMVFWEGGWGGALLLSSWFPCSLMQDALGQNRQTSGPSEDTKHDEWHRCDLWDWWKLSLLGGSLVVMVGNGTNVHHSYSFIP